MIQNFTGDVLSAWKGVIVHGCNAQGVMGSGVAAQVKRRFPEAYDVYQRQCAAGDGKLGSISFVEVAEGKWIVNAITQYNYGRDGRRYVSYDAVADAFAKVGRLAEDLGAEDIHFPMIGAGLGGGDWRVIEAIIESETQGLRKTLWTPQSTY